MKKNSAFIISRLRTIVLEQMIVFPKSKSRRVNDEKKKSEKVARNFGNISVFNRVVSAFLIFIGTSSLRYSARELFARIRGRVSTEHFSLILTSSVAVCIRRLFCPFLYRLSATLTFLLPLNERNKSDSNDRIVVAGAPEYA